ncbi:MAG: hypothetical protein WDM89_17165 [Rhizomicrobium sp.]
MALSTHLVLFGNFGSDAGYWYIGADGKIHHVPGWNPEQLSEVSKVVSILGQLAALKTPGLAERVSSVLTEFVQKEVGAYAKEAGGISIISV